MNLKHLLVGPALATIMATGSAQADVIFTLGNHPQADEENILFQDPETGPTITGATNQSDVPIIFTSLTGQTLFQKAQGQADIENAADPGEVLLNSIEITAPGYGWGDFILNLNNGQGEANVTATDNFNHSFSYALGNGQNFLTLTTVNNEIIQEIEVQMTDLDTDGWRKFKQPRISDLCPLTNPNCTSRSTDPVPEPTSLALLGSALLGLAGAYRLRRRR